MQFLIFLKTQSGFWRYLRLKLSRLFNPWISPQTKPFILLFVQTGTKNAKTHLPEIQEGEVVRPSTTGGASTQAPPHKQNALIAKSESECYSEQHVRYFLAHTNQRPSSEFKILRILQCLYQTSFEILRLQTFDCVFYEHLFTCFFCLPSFIINSLLLLVIL